MFDTVTRRLRDIDWILVLAALLLLGLGLTAIHYATLLNVEDHKNVAKQAISMAIGLGAMSVLTFMDYRNLSRSSMILYWVVVFLLLVVLKMGDQASAKGSARWIKLPGGFSLQPSELAKLVTILVMGNYLVRVGEKIKELPVLLRSLALIGLPMVLIIKQPDLGTGLVVGAIWLGMTHLGGARPAHLLGILAVGISIFGLAWKFDKREILLKDYQRQRVIVLIDPTIDKKLSRKARDEKEKAVYQFKQGRIAIAGGQVTGQGLGQGLQTNSNHVPENHNDFIFSAIAEESGFVGSVGMLLLFLVLLWRALTIVIESEDYLGKLLAGGVASLFGFHVIVNIAMNTGIAPVVGVPLPLISYGGSAVITNLAALGLLMAARLGRRKIEFSA